MVPDLVDPATLTKPRWRFSAAWWEPWTITDWWRPQILRSCDEWHNPSFGLIIPPFGGIVFWRMHYARVEEELHLYGWSVGEWEGLHVAGCDFCDEIVNDVGRDDPVDGVSDRSGPA
jgi:hypothetical protein